MRHRQLIWNKTHPSPLTALPEAQDWEATFGSSEGETPWTQRGARWRAQESEAVDGPAPLPSANQGETSMGRPSRQEKQGTVHLGTGSAPNDPSGPLRPSVEGGGPRALSPLYAPLPVDPLWGGWGHYLTG